MSKLMSAGSGAVSGAAAGAALGPIGAGVGGVIGGLAGLFGSGDSEDEQAKKAREEALAAITGVSSPSIEEQKIALQKLSSAGELDPQTLATITQGDSRLSNVSTDPRLKSAQMNALMSLQKQGETGFSASDLAALNSSRQNVNRDVQGRNQAALQGMAQRGMGGSGAELAEQLMNSQAGAERGSQESDRTAAMAQQNALQATANAASSAGNIRGQDYGEQANAAKAQDTINQFNSQNRQNVGQYNTGTANQAQAANLANTQRILDSNVGLTNQQEVANKGLYQQQFANNMYKAKAVAGQQGEQADYYSDQADKTRAAASGLGQGATKAGLALGTYLNSAPKAPSIPTGKNLNQLDQGTQGPLRPDGSYAHGGYVAPTKQAIHPYGNPHAQMSMKSSHDMQSDSHIPLLKFLAGGTVPGEAKVEGDSPKNDTVNARLSPGEFVIPRSIIDSGDEAILDFIHHVKKNKKGR